MVSDLSTFDYLFLKFRSLHVKLEDVVKNIIRTYAKKTCWQEYARIDSPFHASEWMTVKKEHSLWIYGSLLA